MFTPENSLLQRSKQLLSTCPPSHPASHPTRPSTRPCQPPDPASHQSLLSKPFLARHAALLAFPACLPSLPSCQSSSGTVKQTLQGASAVLSSCKGCMCGMWAKVQSPNISYTHFLISCPPPPPPNILCIPFNSLCTLSNILLTLPKFCVTHLIHTPLASNILYTTSILGNPSNILCKPYVWCHGHPTGTALAPRGGNDLRCMEVDWYEMKTSFTQFHIRIHNAKNWAWNPSLVAQLLSSKLPLSPFGQPRMISQIVMT